MICCKKIHQPYSNHAFWSIKKPWGGGIKTLLFLKVFVLSFVLGYYFFHLEGVFDILVHSPINLRQFFNFNVCLPVWLSINRSYRGRPYKRDLMKNWKQPFYNFYMKFMIWLDYARWKYPFPGLRKGGKWRGSFSMCFI